MANIKVDHSQFERTASAIDTYIRNHKSKMNSIDNSITALGTAWQGSDYTLLSHKCALRKGITKPNSKSFIFPLSLPSHSQALWQADIPYQRLPC